jgi:hypothetical protein
VAVEDLLGAAEALGHVVAGELDVDPARDGALGPVDGEEGAQLGHDVVEAARLVPVRGGEGVAVHRVAGPHDRVAGRPDRPDERGQERLDLAGAEPGDQGEPPRLAGRVQRGAQLHDLLGGGRRAELEPDRVVHAREEGDVGAVGLAGALPHPQHVGRGVVPVPGETVAPGHGLLVAEQQRLVGGEEVDLVQLGLGRQVDAAGLHEAQGPLDAVGDDRVAAAGRAAGDELLVPGVDPVQVGEPALGEGAHQVQRGGRLVVGPADPLGVGAAAVRVGGQAVDDVAAEDGQLDAVDNLDRGRAGLGELARDPSHLDHGQARAVGEHGGHLQDDLQLVADDVGGEGVEGLGAVARLEQEAAALGHPGELAAQRPGLAREDQRGQGGQVGQHGLERDGVGPVGLLGGGQRSPAAGGPGGAGRRVAGPGQVGPQVRQLWNGHRHIISIHSAAGARRHTTFTVSPTRVPGG